MKCQHLQEIVIGTASMWMECIIRRRDMLPGVIESLSEHHLRLPLLLPLNEVPVDRDRLRDFHHSGLRCYMTALAEEMLTRIGCGAHDHSMLLTSYQALVCSFLDVFHRWL